MSSETTTESLLRTKDKLEGTEITLRSTKTSTPYRKLILRNTDAVLRTEKDIFGILGKNWV